jgi:3-dehydroquinate synthase
MVDACLGGKTAVNHAGVKNLVGALHHPRLIRLDVSALETLPADVFVDGLAESVKHAAVLDASLLEWHEAHAEAIRSRRPDAWRELAPRNLRLKAAVVAADEREDPAAAAPGRAALNFGHTVGHALESASGYAWRHGVCVSLGMAAEMEAAVAAGRLAAADRDRIEALLARLGLPLRAPARLDPAAVLARMPRDKKARGARPRLVIPDGPGRAAWYAPADDEPLRAALRRILG